MKKRLQVLVSASIIVLAAHTVSVAQWTQTGGPKGGRIVSLLVNGSTIFAGSFGTGMFASTDNGANWSDVHGGFPRQTYVYALAGTGADIFAGTSNGIFHSTDNGLNWTPSNQGLPDPKISALAVDGLNLIAATSSLVYISTDLGGTWTASDSGLAGLSVFSFAVSGTSIFAGTQNGVYLSKDHGASWNPDNSGMQNNLVQGIAVSGSDLFAGTSASGVFRSTDNGLDWIPVNNGFPNTVNCVLAVPGAGVFFGTPSGVFVSIDGISLSPFNTGLADSIVYSLALTGTNLLAGTYSAGVYQSPASVPNWAPLNTGLVLTGIHALYAAGPTLFASTSTAGSFRSTDAGVNWLPMNSALQGAGVFSFVAVGKNLYAGTDRGIFLSTDEGTGWLPLNPNLPNVVSFLVSGINLFAGQGGESPGGAFLSTDNGATWNPVNAGLTNTGINALAMSGPNLFAATNGGVFRSPDNGLDWVPAGTGLTDSIVLSMAVSGTNLFAATSSAGVFLSKNYGTDWIPVNNGLANISITALTALGDDIFAATVGNGVFSTTDDGNSWTPVNTGMTDFSTGPLVADDAYLFSGTTDRGVWRRPLSEFASTIPLANLSLWLRADRGVTKDPANLVSQWADLSKNVNHGYQSLSNAQPLYVQNAVNGQPAIGFNNSYLQTAALAVADTAQFTFFSVIRYDSAQSTYSVPLWNGIDDPVSGYGMGYRKPGSQVVGAGWGNSGGEAKGDVVYAGQTIVHTATYDQRSHRFFEDGVLRDSVPFNQSKFTGGVFTVGNIGGAAAQFPYPFTGAIGEIIVYDTRLGDQQRSAVESYLKSKYAIAPSFSAGSRNINFGNILVGTSQPETLSVTNTGSGTMTLSSVRSDGAEFTVPPLTSTLLSHASRPVIITFTPASTGAKNARIVFTHDGTSSPDSILVSGTGVAPAFSVAPALVSFGNVVAGQSKPDSVRVKNTGSSTLTIFSDSSSDNVFTIVPPAASIAAGDSQRFDIRFSPVSGGVKNGRIFFKHDGPTSLDSILVSGTGVAPGFSVVPALLSFGTIVIGQSKPDSVRVSNTGSSTLTITSVSSDVNGFSVSPPASSIAPGASQNFIITFSPVSAGTTSGHIVFLHDGQTSSDTVSVNGTAIPLVISPVLGPAIAGSSVQVGIPLPPGYPPLTGLLLYRQAGNALLDSALCVRSGDTLRAAIPADSVTLRGLEYSIRLNNGRLSTVYPPAGTVAVLQVTVGSAKAGGSFRAQEYKMISVPVELTHPSIGSVLGDDYGVYDSLVWRVFRWEGGSYSEFNSTGAAFTPGTAFWLITRDGKQFTIDHGRSVVSSHPDSVVVQPGWNQIGDPFAFPVSWSTIGFAPPLVSDTAVKGPYYFDGSSYRYGDSTLVPWEGYFVLNTLSVPETLLIQPTAVPAAFPKASHSTADNSGDAYTLRLSARIPESGLKDLNTVIGFRTDAKIGLDRYDYPKPPVVSDYVDLSIVEAKTNFMGDFKPVPTDGQLWKARLTSSKSNTPVQITLTEEGRLPAGFNRYLLDRDNFNVIPPGENTFSLRIGAPGVVRSIDIIIGTREYAEKHSGGIQLVPAAFALFQNYPNPFNPETKIRYRLAGRSQVRLEIFDPLGQHVRTLVNEEQVTGEHSVVWDGTSEAGNPASSGMYLCRLRAADATPGSAGGFSAVRKLLLIR